MNEEMYDQYAMQSDLQNQVSEAQRVAYAPQLYEQVQQAQSILIEQTNPSKVLEEISLKLKGKIKKHDGTVIMEGDPLMNYKGINRMLFIMSSIINQNTILSYLEKHEIEKLMIQLSDDIVDDLTLNWREYEIKDKIMLDHIVDAILIPAFCALKRALEKNEKNWLGKISIENIGQEQKIQPKKGGLLSKFKL